MLPFFSLLDFIHFITKKHLINFYEVLLLSKSLYYCFNLFVNLCYVFHLSGSFVNSSTYYEFPKLYELTGTS
jgi:hypothetical protein